MTRWSYERIQELLAQFVGTEGSDDPKERKRRRIIAAASELFVKHGYRKTSLEDVARKAHVAKGTLYLYFKNKADLFVHVIALEKAEYLVCMKPIFDEDLDPEVRLRRFLAAGLEMVTRMPLVSRLNAGNSELQMVLDEMDPEMMQQNMASGLDMYRGLLEDFAEAGGWTEEELDERTRALTSMMMASTQLMDERLRGSISVERYAQVLADVLVMGFVPRGGKA